MKTTAIILAGGKSSRFGQDKTLYPIQGKTMTERAAGILRPFVDEILISVEKKGKFNLPGTREVVDIYKEIGPIGGIYTGLLQAEGENCLVIAGDMPKIDKELTLKLLAAAKDCPAVIPLRDRKPEPLYGVYKKELLPGLKKWILMENYSVRDFLIMAEKSGKCLFYPLKEEEKSFFFNINCLKDTEKVKNLDN